MSRHLPYSPLIAFLVMMSFGLLGPMAAQLPRRTVQARVVDDLRRDGIGGTEVTLRRGGEPASRVVASDDSGSVTFRNVEPGTYQLEINRDGYFPLTYPNILVGNSDVKLGDLLITAKRTVSGTVQ